MRKSALTPRGFAGLLADGLAGLLPAWRLVRRAGTDGVYVSTITIPSWSVIARLAGRRVALHVHEAESAAPRIVRRLLALPALLASGVLVNSRYSQEVLLESAPRVRDRTVVVYNGIAGPAAVMPPRAGLDGPVRLAYVGRLSQRKGPQVAVAALGDLVRRGHDARLVLAGSVFPGYEWFEEELRGQVEAEGLTDRVSFVGFVPDVWGLLADADVVLIPSVLDEPFGNTAVEAVLAARPVIVSATSGLREAAAGYASAQAVQPGAVEQVVVDWPRFAAAAVTDAAEARARHDPDRYRSEVARLVAARGKRDRA
jgi:glycosyltransferase involved in cell wall biosynthesis